MTLLLSLLKPFIPGEPASSVRSSVMGLKIVSGSVYEAMSFG